MNRSTAPARMRAEASSPPPRRARYGPAGPAFQRQDLAHHVSGEEGVTFPAGGRGRVRGHQKSFPRSTADVADAAQSS